ncbi:hypothetical protein K3G63_12540 [Hymenobacter sp. HSC-4F20]|uniref:hypothetical protein n=1 Tax=Hymenobacter sp. HSC-4F20 TaxID=2864135 RepID=UPI001C7360B6|nr:hypothetical protein [Hymenobacter sp. HSC-4F20]MBX0291272.1 hypothetical protein [Hymenobacter sp. HSC-4F20]
MKYLLLFLLPGLLVSSAAAAQSKSSGPAGQRLPPLPPLPTASLQPIVTVTQAAPAATSTRFRYQRLTLRGSTEAFLAPAWRGIVRLKPDKRKRDFLGNDKEWEVEALVMQTLNELIEDGWELVEVHNLVQPTGITQTVETKENSSNPERPTYVSSVVAGAYRETSYLFRRPLEERGK